MGFNPEPMPCKLEITECPSYINLAAFGVSFVLMLFYDRQLPYPHAHTRALTHPRTHARILMHAHACPHTYPRMHTHVRTPAFSLACMHACSTAASRRCSASSMRTRPCPNRTSIGVLRGSYALRAARYTATCCARHTMFSTRYTLHATCYMLHSTPLHPSSYTLHPKNLKP